MTLLPQQNVLLIKRQQTRIVVVTIIAPFYGDHFNCGNNIVIVTIEIVTTTIQLC